MALCDSEMRAGGYVPVCSVYGRAADPGWYAVVCGQLGCGTSYGQNTLREAQQVAASECFKVQTVCSTHVTAYGEDLYAPSKKASGTKK
jgi:hypothetical protein